MRVYLDNCCYNRPYDNHSQLTVSLESQAKLLVQSLIQQGQIELAASYMLVYENSVNPYEMRRDTIAEFIERNASVYVDIGNKKIVENIASEIMNTGVKHADACHVACAVIASCDYFLTTDKRLLKYRPERMQILNPIDFVRILGGENDDK